MKLRFYHVIALLLIAFSLKLSAQSCPSNVNWQHQDNIPLGLRIFHGDYTNIPNAIGEVKSTLDPINNISSNYLYVDFRFDGPLVNYLMNPSQIVNLMQSALENAIANADRYFPAADKINGFNMTIYYPSCKLFRTLRRPFLGGYADFSELLPCSSECCSLQVRVQYVNGNLKIRNVLTYPPTSCNNCASCMIIDPQMIFYNCISLCAAGSNIQPENPNDFDRNNPCFYPCDWADIKNIDVGLNPGIEFKHSDGNCRIAPRYTIVECPDRTTTIYLNDVLLAGGVFPSGTNARNSILQYATSYALKYLLNYEGQKEVKVIVPEMVQDLANFQIVGPNNCCEMTFIVNKTYDKTFALLTRSNLCFDPPYIDEWNGHNPLLAEYVINENCDLECYWRINGNKEITEDNFIGPTNGQDFIVKTGADAQNVETMRITSSGKIGFGVNSPIGKFEIKGLGSEGLTSTLKLFNSNEASIFNIFDNGDIHVGGYIRSINSQDPVRISKLNIGVGSPDPLLALKVVGTSKITGDLDVSYNLKVLGTIYTTEVLIKDPATWPDYVFDQDYKLKSLYEISDYIKKNGHLPEVPSKDSVEKDGIKLAEMQTLLLKKIEELTIHMIELKKENDLLRQEVESIKQSK